MSPDEPDRRFAVRDPNEEVMRRLRVPIEDLCPRCLFCGVTVHMTLLDPAHSSGQLLCPRCAYRGFRRSISDWYAQSEDLRGSSMADLTGLSDLNDFIHQLELDSDTQSESTVVPVYCSWPPFLYPSSGSF